MAGLQMPIRGGNRGGQGNFKWDDVKVDAKHRENYLAHSIMAPVGRWQKGKDLQWFAREKSKDGKMVVPEQIQSELDQIRMAEQDALAEALGLGKTERKIMGGPLTNEDVKAVFGKDEAAPEEPDRVGGLGFGSHESMMMGKPNKLKLAADFEGIKLAPVGAQPSIPRAAMSAETKEALEIQERLQKAMEEVRRAKEKKEKKKSKKEHKHKKGSRHDSDDDDSDRERHGNSRKSSHHHHADRSRDDSRRSDRDREGDREKDRKGDRERDRDRARDSDRAAARPPRARSRSRSPPRSRQHRSRSRSRSPSPARSQPQQRSRSRSRSRSPHRSRDQASKPSSRH